MASPAPQSEASEPERTVLHLLSPWVDVFSKAAVGIGLALYGSGFLITSLHQANYGFIEANPFRTRVLAAGAWFSLFAGIPVVIIMAYRSSHRQMKLKAAANFLYAFYMICLGLSWPAWVFFTFSTEGTHKPNKWWLIAGLVALVALIIVRDLKTVPDYVPPISSIVLVLLFVAQDVQFMVASPHIQQPSITVCFFAVGLVTLFISLRPPKHLEDSYWVQPLFYVLLALFFFSSYYYPNLKSSWGGGSAVPITLYFTKDSALKPNQSVSAQLLDESDSGFYIIGLGETKAIFVPRSAVSLVYFSDKTSDSKLLK